MPDTVLGFDFGKRRIGVAVGITLTRTATPLVTLQTKNQRLDWTAIARLIEVWQPGLLVVGLPLNMDDSEQELSRASRRFARQLEGRFELPVAMADERLTSREARAQLATRGGAKARDAVDSVAAQLILETWFASLQGQHGQ